MKTVTTTYLQMLSPDELQRKRPNDAHFQILEAKIKQWQYSKFLYALVGSAWEWRDKLQWTDAQWEAHAHDSALRTFVGYYTGTPAGYFELQRQPGDEVELAHFGLSPTFLGRGLGGPLLSAATEEAWNMKPRRVWVHTCDLDHPNALVNYQARGFKVYKVETQ